MPSKRNPVVYMQDILTAIDLPVLERAVEQIMRDQLPDVSSR